MYEFHIHNIEQKIKFQKYVENVIPFMVKKL